MSLGAWTLELLDNVVRSHVGTRVEGRFHGDQPSSRSNSMLYGKSQYASAIVCMLQVWVEMLTGQGG